MAEKEKGDDENLDPQYKTITNKDEFKFLSNNFDYVSKIQESVRKMTLFSPITLAVLGVTAFTGVASFGVAPIALGTSVSGLLLLTTIWGYSNQSKELIYISSVISASLENYISYLVLVNSIIQNARDKDNAKDIKMLYDKININIMKYIFWILTVLEEGSNDIKKAIDKNKKNDQDKNDQEKNVQEKNIEAWYNKFIQTIEKNYKYYYNENNNDNDNDNDKKNETCKYIDNPKTISEHEECNTYGNVIRRRCDRLQDKVKHGVTLQDRVKTSAKKTFRPSSQLYSELIREYVILSATVTMLQGQMEIYKVLHEDDYTTGVIKYVERTKLAEEAKTKLAEEAAKTKLAGGKKSRHNRKSKKSKKTKKNKSKSKKNKRRSSMHSRNKNA